MFFVVLSIVLLVLLVIVIAFAAKFDRDCINAERALRLCQEAMMRGSSVERIRSNSTSPAADEWHYRILTHNGAIRLTSEQFEVGRQREIRESSK